MIPGRPSPVLTPYSGFSMTIQHVPSGLGAPEALAGVFDGFFRGGCAATLLDCISLTRGLLPRKNALVRA